MTTHPWSEIVHKKDRRGDSTTYERRLALYYTNVYYHVFVLLVGRICYWLGRLLARLGLL